MIRLTDYRTYFSTVAQLLAIPTVRLVVNEKHIISHIRNMADNQFPVMFLVIPSYDTNARDEDSIQEPMTGLLFILSKVDRTSETEETMLEVMQQTQDLIQAVKTQMRTDREIHGPGHLLHYIDFSKFHTDPEYDLSGCDGWSLSFIINSPGF